MLHTMQASMSWHYWNLNLSVGQYIEKMYKYNKVSTAWVVVHTLAHTSMHTQGLLCCVVALTAQYLQLLINTHYVFLGGGGAW